MISYIKWKVIDLDYSFVTILTNWWVWYDILINELTFSNLKIEEECELFIYHYRTENSENLFWFLNFNEKSIFSEIIKISWIWWKVALSILSIWVNNLVSAIQNEDTNMISSIKWIGKKMSEKLILEMKDKKFLSNIENTDPKKENNSINKDLFASIKETLVNMWYNNKTVENALLNLPSDIKKEVWEILPYIIKELS